jgi:hypothetical protein
VNKIEDLEKRIGKRFPEDYRAFLLGHENHLLDHPIIFLSPRSGMVDMILTAEDILENDEKKRIGIAERSLLHIGGNLLGGYLYLDLSDSGFGQIHYMENYIFRETHPSFTALLAEPRAMDEE